MSAVKVGDGLIYVCIAQVLRIDQVRARRGLVARRRQAEREVSLQEQITTLVISQALRTAREVLYLNVHHENQLGMVRYRF